MAHTSMQLGGPFEPLIGAAGVDFVSDTLSGEHPQGAIRKIQGRCSMQHPLVEPLLGLVDELGVSRAGACTGAMLRHAMHGLLCKPNAHARCAHTIVCMQVVLYEPLRRGQCACMAFT